LLADSVEAIQRDVDRHQLPHSLKRNRLERYTLIGCQIVATEDRTKFYHFAKVSTPDGRIHHPHSFAMMMQRPYQLTEKLSPLGNRYSVSPVHRTQYERGIVMA
jgi:hypothetical protein